MVNRIQNIRKTSNFNVTDGLTIEIEDHKIIRQAVAHYSDYSKAEVLGNAIHLGKAEHVESVELTEEINLKNRVEDVVEI